MNRQLFNAAFVASLLILGGYAQAQQSVTIHYSPIDFLGGIGYPASLTCISDPSSSNVAARLCQIAAPLSREHKITCTFDAAVTQLTCATDGVFQARAQSRAVLSISCSQSGTNTFEVSSPNSLCRLTHKP